MFKENYESELKGGYGYLPKEDNFTVTLERLPERDEVPIEITESLVVEYYSKL